MDIFAAWSNVLGSGKRGTGGDDEEDFINAVKGAAEAAEAVVVAVAVVAACVLFTEWSFEGAAAAAACRWFVEDIREKRRGGRGMDWIGWRLIVFCVKYILLEVNKNSSFIAWGMNAVLAK